MYYRIQQACSQGIRAIAQEQSVNGSFFSYSSTSKHNFAKGLEYATTFASSLILDCLNSLKSEAELEVVKKKIQKFLLQQKTESWSWNYWQRESREYKVFPYPDDLDDTACALAALSRCTSDKLSGHALGKVTQLLISAETQVGGPYRTWLTISDNSLWADVDPVINSNIAYFLKLQSISLPPLCDYLDSIITSSQYISRYYASWHPVIYFLSRGYTGNRKANLVKYIMSSKEQDGSWAGSALYTALCVSALLRLGAPVGDVETSIDYIVSSQNQFGMWPAYGMWMDPQRAGRIQYAGSSVLTTAFCLEALQLFFDAQGVISGSLVTVSDTTDFSESVIALAKARFSNLENQITEVASEYIHEVAHMDSQIILLPWTCVQNFDTEKNIAREQITQLALANLYGWIAYDIFDDVIDRGINGSSVPLATIFFREFCSIYDMLMSRVPEFQSVYTEVMDTLDTAIRWEYLACKVNIQDGMYYLPLELPYIDDLSKLAEKSLGHILSPLMILALKGYSISSLEFVSVQKFFRHYLTARQLHDDAHDWKEDFEAGFINSASSILFTDWFSQGHGQVINIRQDIVTLQRIFWSQTIKVIVGKVLEHTAEARSALARIHTVNVDFLSALLLPLEQGANEAMYMSEQTWEFIYAYKHLNLN